ncbi:MAG: V-type ATP synthase subunit D [Rikenellaceae bacterium]|jgi:V/A-type H+-transporting ATPase subunit D|nr:V-type ATP synthase subunit D [Rikenellaceae bacterium]
MAVKFQFNKTSLAEMNKQLKVRTRALPTIKSKESALRLEVKRAKDMATEYVRQLDELSAQYDYMVALWGEFDPELLRVEDVRMSHKKIAGVAIPVLDQVIFAQKPYDIFSSPIWIADGVELLKRVARLGLEYEFHNRRTRLLDHARKKTTQKVNLYEKVQIPGYQDAILRIKRFLEDEENLSKSAQKIVKTRQESMEEGAV